MLLRSGNSHHKNGPDRLHEPGVSTAAPSSAPALRVTNLARGGSAQATADYLISPLNIIRPRVGRSNCLTRFACASFSATSWSASSKRVRHRETWPDLHYQTVTGALLLSPSPPRIAPSQLRLGE